MMSCAVAESSQEDPFYPYEEKGELKLREVNVIGDTGRVVIGEIETVTVSPSHELWISDPSNAWLWVTDLRGNYLRTFGRKGHGPGEFLIPTAGTFSAGDTLFVLDAGQRRVTAFGPSPTRKYLFSIQLSQATSRGRIPSAILGLRGMDIVMMDMTPASESSNPWLIFRSIDFRGEVQYDSILVLEGPELHLVQLRPGHVVSHARPFGRESLYAFVGEQLCHAWTERLHVTCVAADGTEREVLSFDLVNADIRRSDIDRRVHSMSTLDLQMVQRPGWHRTYPAMDAMVVGTDGRYWIHRPPVTSPARWLVFDIEAQTYNHAYLPAGQRVIAATDRYVYTTMAPSRPEIWIYEMVE